MNIAGEKVAAFGRIIEQSQGEVYLFDAETLALLQCNSGAQKNLGYSVQEMSRLTVRDILAPHVADGYLAAAKRLQESSDDNQSTTFETVHRRHDGSTYDVEVHLQLATGDDDRPTFAAVAFDISRQKRAESALQQSNQRFSALVRNLPLVVYRCANDSQWTMSFISDQVEAISGYPPRDFVGNQVRSFASIIHPDDVDHVAATVDAAIQQRQTYQIEYRIRHRDGSVRNVVEKGQAILDDQDQPLYLDGVIDDVTQQRQAQDALRVANERWRLAARAGQIGVWDYDITSNRLIWDDQMYRLYGISPDAFSGTYDAWENSVHPDDLERARNQLQAAIRGEADFDTEFRVVWPDGSIHHLKADGAVQCDQRGNPLRIIGVNWDVTLLRLAKEAAEQASQAKSGFLASMSHELRTPLNGVISMIDLLRDTTLDDRQRRFLDAALTNARSLLDLINDVLDFSRIESGRLDLDEHPFSIQQAVDDAVAMMGHRAHANGLELYHYVDPRARRWVIGDNVRLRQVLVNLLSNAVTFTETGHITVRCMLNDDEDIDSVTIRCAVTDTGIGISQDHIPRLFQSFSQPDPSTARRYGGSGLGLSICKSLVEAMNGEIGVDSQPGKGSTFWFTARLRRAPNDEASQLFAPPDLRGLRVLAVDQNETGRGILTAMFEAWGMDVQAVSPDDEVIRTLGANAESEAPFHLVVVDVPVVGDGIARAVEDLIAATEQLDCRVFLLTPTQSDLPWAADHVTRVDRCITKPPCASEVLDALVTAFCADPERWLTRTKDVAEQLAKVQFASGRVLLAEDNRTNCMFVTEVLKRAGLECDIAENGAEAVDAIMQQQDRQYDLVLMDCQMPEMDGLEATRAIRNWEAEHEPGRRVPIVALTANAIKGDRERCLDAGMDDYLAKPVDSAQLLQKITSYLRTTADKSTPPGGRAADTAASTSSAPAATPFDPEAMLARCMNDASFFASILDSFVEEMPKYLNDLERNLASGNAGGMSKAAHAIKGAAGMITAARAHEIAAELEMLCRQGELDDVAAGVQSLKEELHRCEALISEIQSGPANQSNSRGSGADRG